MLDIRWLEDFLAVANTRSFTKAADVGNVTQSGLSRRVQSLEHWAGTALIDRAAVPLGLTEAGKDFYPVATSVVHSLTQIRQQLADRARHEARTVKFTAPHLLSTTFFPDWLPRISQIGGNTDIVVVSQNLLDCFQALDRADVNFIVCLADRERSMMRRIPEQFRVDGEMIVKVGEEKLVPVSAPATNGTPRHPIGTAHTALLQYTPECSLGWAVEDLLRVRSDVHARVVSTNPFADGLRLMVSGGLGAAWLPQSLIQRELQSGSIVRAAQVSFDIPLDVVVIRPTYRLGAHAERIWKRISEGAQSGDQAVVTPRLNVVS